MITAFQLAVKNVYRKKERSILTIIGVLLAVGSFISLLSLAEGLQTRINREIDNRNVDVYVLPADAATLPTGPMGTIGFSSEVLPLKMVKMLENTEKFPNIKSVCPIYRVPQNLTNQTVVIWGLEPEQFSSFFPEFKLQKGRTFEAEAWEVVVGGNLAQDKGIAIDTKIPLQGKSFTTVGIGMPRGGFQDYFCYIPLENAMKLKDARGVQEIWIQLSQNDPASRRKMADALSQYFPKFKIKTREDYMGSAGDYVKLAWILQFAIASIGVLIAVTAAMNTMLISTYERIKEFGTLRSIGASRFTVFLMILIESLILCFIGGIAGTVLGVMGSQLLDTAVLTLLQLSFPLARITFPLILYAFLLSGCVGVIAAIIPAVIVYRMKIITALRWE